MLMLNNYIPVIAMKLKNVDVEKKSKRVKGLPKWVDLTLTCDITF